MPIPLINFDDPIEKGKHDQIRDLQIKLNNLYKTICSSDERNKTTLNRQFERDRIHMDQLIADLYQLGKLDAKIPSIEELYRNL